MKRKLEHAQPCLCLKHCMTNYNRDIFSDLRNYLKEILNFVFVLGNVLEIGTNIF